MGLAEGQPVATPTRSTYAYGVHTALRRHDETT